jgi:hypothetical protein
MRLVQALLVLLLVGLIAPPLSVATSTEQQQQQQEEANHGLHRQLQDINLDDYFGSLLNFDGVVVSHYMAQELCPDEWLEVMVCIIRDCPNFVGVCVIEEPPPGKYNRRQPKEELEGKCAEIKNIYISHQAEYS